MNRLLAGMILSAGCLGNAYAQGTLLDGNAEFTRGTNAWDEWLEADFKGVSNPLDVDNLSQTGWAFRIAGDTRETFLPTPDNQTYDLEPQSQLEWFDLANRGLLSARERVTLTGSDPVPGEPLHGRVSMTLDLTNIANVPITLAVFHLLDPNIAGTPGDDSAELVLPISEPTIRFTDANGLIGYYTGADVDAFSVRTRGPDDPQAMLADDDVDDFDDGGLPSATDDVMAGFEWMNRTLQPGETLTVNVRFSINRATVDGDLRVAMSAAPNPVTPDSVLELAANVLNVGQTPSPDTRLAFNVIGNDVDILGTQGCANDPLGYPECELGLLQPGTSANVVLRVSPGLESPPQLAAEVTAGAPDIEDLVPEDNVATVAVQVSQPQVDLRILKSNTVGGVAVDIDGWHWVLMAGNSAAATDPALFATGDVVFVDQLPDTLVSYGAPSTSTSGDVDGSVSCSLTGFDLICRAATALAIAPGGAVRVSLPVLPLALQPYANPRAGGQCVVDPGDQVTEANENNNTCNDTVQVIDHLLFADGFED